MKLLQKTAGQTASAEKFCFLKFLNSYKLQKLHEHTLHIHKNRQEMNY